MSSRRDQKESLRRERIAQQEAEAKAKARQRRGAAVFVVAILAAAAVAGVVVVATSGGGSSSDTEQTYSQNSVPAGAEIGAQTTPPPWRPEYTHLAQRLEALGLPGLSEEIFHIHVLLHVYVNGKAVTVPANIGLDQSTATSSPLHTHDTSGIVHIESDRTFPFTIGQFFAVWGVRFANDRLGPYRSGDSKRLEVYVNGERVRDPVDFVMHEHANIVVGYGKPGSFPTEPPASFPSGL